MSETLRQRAELHLLGQLLHAQRDMAREDDRPGWMRTGVEELAARFADHVGVLRAVGAVTESEATAWTERFDAEVGLPVARPVPPEEGVPEGARRLLAELIDSSARGRGPGVMRRDSSPYEHALSALRDCGAISKQEYTRWLERFVEHPDLPPDVAERLRRVRLRPPKPCSGIELERVVVGPATALGGGLQIRHVEIYADGLRLFWHRPGSAEPPAESAPTSMGSIRRARELNEQQRRKDRMRPKPVVCDDLGMRYHGFATRSDGAQRNTDSLVEFERATYSPGIQAQARRLEISHEGTAVHLALGS